MVEERLVEKNFVCNRKDLECAGKKAINRIKYSRLSLRRLFILQPAC